MTYWQSIRWIIKFDFKRWRYSLLFTMICNVAFAINGSLLLRGMKPETGVYSFQMTIIEFYCLIIIPNLGFIFFNGDYLNYWKGKPFTGRLVFLMNLPFNHAQLIIARYITMLLTMCLMAPIFFAGLYWGFSSHFDVAISDYILFALTWTGYGLAICSVYIFMEQGFGERVYFWLTMLSCFVFLCTIVVLWAAKFNIAYELLKAIDRWGLLVPLLAIAAGGVISWIMIKNSEARMKIRAFH